MRILLTLFFLFIANQAFASTYYVRSDGGCPCTVGNCTGSSTAGCANVCNGLTDAPYSGGASPNCALNHPNWVFPPRGGATDTKAVTGDTVVLGASKVADSFRIGCQNSSNCRDASVNISSSTYCDSSYANECQMSQGGTTLVGLPDNLTLIGCTTSGCSTNTDRPVLWGAGRVDRVLNVNGSTNVILKDFEITDHEAGTQSKELVCGVSASNLSGLDGIYANGGSNLTLNNVYIHGMCRYGMKVGGVAGISMTNVVIDKNGWSGWSLDTCSAAGTCGVTGNITLLRTQITYSGCAEEYPVTHTGTDAILAHSCRAQADNIIADGIESADMAGNWVITDSNISHNTHDGPDLLYHNKGAYSGGTIVMKRNIFEGNGGNQLKSSNALYAEDNLVLGNCGYFENKTYTSNTWSDGSDSCRAGGNAVEVSFKNNGTVPYLVNNTILSNGDVGIDTAGTCPSGTNIVVKNNILLGGRQHNDDTSISGSGTNDSSSIFYNSNVNCNATLVEAYNLCYGWKEGSSACNGLNSTDTIEPAFVGSPIAMGPVLGLGYYTGDNLASQVYLTAGSTALNLSDETVPGADALDYNSLDRGASWDAGALEYGSIPSEVASITRSKLSNSAKLLGRVSLY